MSNRRERRSLFAEFKQQIVKLFESGKPRGEIIREYEFSSTAFDRWIKQRNPANPLKKRSTDHRKRMNYFVCVKRISS